MSTKKVSKKKMKFSRNMYYVVENRSGYVNCALISRKPKLMKYGDKKEFTKIAYESITKSITYDMCSKEANKFGFPLTGPTMRRVKITVEEL